MRYATLLAAAVALGACDNDVQLLDDTGPVPVVFGIYNASAGEQLLSVTKTFQFADGGSAEASARLADSVYYDPERLSVRVRNAGTGESVAASRENVSERGVVRDPGAFDPDANFYYVYDAEPLGLGVGDTLALELELDGAPVGESAIARLPELALIGARLPEVYGFDSDQSVGFSFGLAPDAPAETGIALYELGFEFAFTESSPGGEVRRSVYWPAAAVSADESQNIIRYTPEGLFDFLAANLAADPEVTRSFHWVRAVVTGGDVNFDDYRQFLDASTGITATQELPPFSNVAGGLGLYGSVTQIRQDTVATLTPDSFDELRDGERTRALNFVP